MLASVLQEQGFKVGLYTSPHLKDFRERIKINGQVIPEEWVIDFVAKYKDHFQQLQLSFFEMTVGMAFTYYKEQQVDIAVIEVGMGGRLDSTNVITPLVTVITNIGFDHMAFLGDTLEKIAGEKAGIIKQGAPVVIGKTQTETKAVFLKKAGEANAPITFADQLEQVNFECDLKGIYQKENIQTAYAALERLPEEFKPTEENIRNGIANVVKNTGLRGRWETLQTKPLVIVDTGHNEDGIKLALAQISQTPYEHLHMVWGMVNDKDVAKVLALLPKDARYYFCQPSIPRALPVTELAHAATAVGLTGTKYQTVPQAMQAALQAAGPDDLIFIGGSTFVVADAI